MSSEEPPVTEWKTIRISASSYYKLVELSGFLTILLGSQTIPISNVADWAVVFLYDAIYSKLKEITSDPDKLEAKRKEIGGSIKRLREVSIKPMFE